MMKIELYRSAFPIGGRWRWRTRARNGKILARSAEGYHNQRDAMHSITQHCREMPQTDVVFL